MYINKILKSKFKGKYGFSRFSLLSISQRLEIGVLSQTYNFVGLQKFILDFLTSKYVFNNYTFKTKHLLNIYLLNLLGTYRGWRHSRGLPVRGQRT